MSRKYLLDCSANGAIWADDVHYKLNVSSWREKTKEIVKSYTYVGLGEAK